MADGILTSILLLDPEGRSLWHGAAPNLPPAYCEAIDGIKIGPNVGSCGTAAYFGRAVYVTDIASDPLWADFRHIALPHDLRACWSTPIRDPEGAVIGTFAVYHRTVSGPTRDEIEAIEMITKHVAQAILLSRGIQDVEMPVLRQDRARPSLKLVPGSDLPGESPPEVARLLQSIEKLQAFANELDRLADMADAESTAEALRAVSADCRRLGSVILSQIENQDSKSAR
jgi:GAF domain-containing protein